jgi:deoxyadenosine/deoxycytidine kinase
MALIAFDTLAYARRLMDAGVSEEQASAQAEVMAEVLLQNVDALVTHDYLDARFSEFEHRIEMRFNELEHRIDQRFVALEQRTDARFAAIDLRFAQLDGKFRLIYWMMGIVIASTTLPQLVSLFGG